MNLRLLFTAILFATLFTSCEKESFIQRKNLKGTWTYVKAEKIKFLSKNENILSDYDDITITIDEFDRFVWTENGNTYEGKVSYDSETTVTDEDDETSYSENILVFSFDDNTEEVFYNFSLRKKRTQIRYFSEDSRYKFTLEKETTTVGRR